jgi:hypothetical protein
VPDHALPDQASLRYLRLEAKRRLAAGEFAALHAAQAAIAREYGLPTWAALKERIERQNDGPAMMQLRWVIARFRTADQPGWTEPAPSELAEHFDQQVLAEVPPATVIAEIAKLAADLRSELIVISQTPLQANVQLAGLRYFAAAAAEPPHRLTGLRGFPLAERLRDPRVKHPPPARILGEPPATIRQIAASAFADLGLPALVLAGGAPGHRGWVLAQGHADLEKTNRSTRLTCSRRPGSPPWSPRQPCSGWWPRAASGWTTRSTITCARCVWRTRRSPSGTCSATAGEWMTPSRRTPIACPS